MAPPNNDVWSVCSACRSEIGFGAVHWVCSVSTCNRNRTRLVFCSVACWDSHLSTLRHREAWAVEELAPKPGEHMADEPALPAPRPQPAVAAAPVAEKPQAAVGSVTAHAGGPALSSAYTHDDVLIVVSKLKKYIRDRSGMNTSDAIADVLADHVRSICDDAIRAAAREGRKTVLDRDVPKPRR
jgi:hypothetical protein